MHNISWHLYHHAHVSVPPLILSDGAALKLLHSALQDLAGIVGKVQVPDLRQRNRYNGKSLFVLFRGTGTNLLSQKKVQIMHLCLFCLCECVFMRMCVHLEHNWSLLLCIDGDTGAGHPGIGAQVPEPHIRVSKE